MASLIIGAGILIHDQVHKRKELKREKKKLAYEARYRELEQEQVSRRSTTANLQAPPRYETIVGGESPKYESMADSSLSLAAAGVRSRTATTVDGLERRNSSESARNESPAVEDGPAHWVNEVVRERSRN